MTSDSRYYLFSRDTMKCTFDIRLATFKFIQTPNSQVLLSINHIYLTKVLHLNQLATHLTKNDL